MATANDIIVHSAISAGKLLRRFTEDLKPQEYLHRPTPQANCTAWLLGHLILADRGILKKLDVADIPELPAGFDKRFARDDTAPQANDFGDVSLLLPLFEKLHALVVQKVRDLSAAELDKPTEKQHPMFSTIGQWLNYMSHHITMHVGQITLIRRSLGRPPIV
jgi:uncharacterized damage-inducible protein DinB